MKSDFEAQMAFLEFSPRNIRCADKFVVYVLFQETGNGEIPLYVGKTTNLCQAIGSKSFDTYTFVACASEVDMARLCIQMIARLRPVENRGFPDVREAGLASLQSMKEIFIGVGLRVLKKAAAEGHVEKYEFLGQVVFDIDQMGRALNKRGN